MVKKFLLDTNICIYYLKGRYNLNERIAQAELQHCFISEITPAELKFGVENSQHKEKNRKVLNDFISGITSVQINI